MQICEVTAWKNYRIKRQHESMKVQFRHMMCLSWKIMTLSYLLHQHKTAIHVINSIHFSFLHFTFSPEKIQYHSRMDSSNDWYRNCMEVISAMTARSLTNFIKNLTTVAVSSHIMNTTNNCFIRHGNVTKEAPSESMLSTFAKFQEPASRENPNRRRVV